MFLDGLWLTGRCLLIVSNEEEVILQPEYCGRIMVPIGDGFGARNRCFEASIWCVLVERTFQSAGNELFAFCGPSNYDRCAVSVTGDVYFATPPDIPHEHRSFISSVLPYWPSPPIFNIRSESFARHNSRWGNPPTSEGLGSKLRRGAEMSENV